jgi:hypothetical protein
MKTIYFPYTTIDPRQAEQAAAIWGPLTVLQASPETCLPEVAALQAAGVIETVFPHMDPARSVTGALQEFKQWAAQHTGGDLAAMMEQGQGIPFFNSQSSAQIVAQIRRGGPAPAGDDPAVDFRETVFQAQLLLAMAQEFDLQQAALARDIEALTVKENEMMAMLKGEDDPDPVKPPRALSEAGSDTMVPLRLKVWARAMAAVEAMKSCYKTDAEILFMTDGQSVLPQIRELFPTAQTRSWLNPLPAKGGRPEVEHLPVWLAGPLTRYAEQASDENGGRPSGLELIEIPHLSVEAFLNRLAGHADRADSEGTGAASTGSCWIGGLLRAGDGKGDAPLREKIS